MTTFCRFSIHNFTAQDRGLGGGFRYFIRIFRFIIKINNIIFLSDALFYLTNSSFIIYSSSFGEPINNYTPKENTFLWISVFSFAWFCRGFD